MKAKMWINKMLRSIYRQFSSKQFKNHDIIALMFTVSYDRPGLLTSALSCFVESNINLTHIESKPADILNARTGYTFLVDFEKPQDDGLSKVVKGLREVGAKVTLLDGCKVPWFPRRVRDLDQLDQRTLAAGAELQSDHPGFSDSAYITRRKKIAEIAFNYKTTDKGIPHVNYTESELATWNTIYNTLIPLQK